MVWPSSRDAVDAPSEFLHCADRVRDDIRRVCSEPGGSTRQPHRRPSAADPGAGLVAPRGHPTRHPQPCRVCFIGDSLTEFWEHTGKADWDLHFAPLKVANIGLTADRTEHILERIRRLDFRRAKPELVVLLMGTNNLGMDPPDKPEEVFRAIQKGVAMIQAKMPHAKVLLLTLPPSGMEPKSALRQRIQETNKLLTGATWPATVRVLPVYEAMVDDADRWRADCTLDGTHFSATGYARLAGLLAPAVKEMLGTATVAMPAR